MYASCVLHVGSRLLVVYMTTKQAAVTRLICRWLPNQLAELGTRQDRAEHIKSAYRHTHDMSSLLGNPIMSHCRIAEHQGAGT